MPEIPLAKICHELLKTCVGNCKALTCEIQKAEDSLPTSVLNQLHAIRYTMLYQIAVLLDIPELPLPGVLLPVEAWTQVHNFINRQPMSETEMQVVAKMLNQYMQENSGALNNVETVAGWDFVMKYCPETRYKTFQQLSNLMAEEI